MSVIPQGSKRLLLYRCVLEVFWFFLFCVKKDFRKSELSFRAKFKEKWDGGELNIIRKFDTRMKVRIILDIRMYYTHS